MKLQRPQLTSDKTVQFMREKYGRCGVSGRKRKSEVILDDSDTAPSPKVPRFKVSKYLDVR